ncbi:MAG TPA: hypothetical protein VFA81_11420 [Burkholderiales bacterium]|nr:hypothetical protein [Burkholderiales bacterium]
MRLLSKLMLVLLACTLLAPLAARSADEDEGVLAQSLLHERQKLATLKADPAAVKDAVIAQERRLMEVRAKLSAVLAKELARQSVDADQWKQVWQGMKDFLRERLRGWLDDTPAPPPPGAPGREGAPLRT